jgi:hypothetical protein
MQMRAKICDLSSHKKGLPMGGRLATSIDVSILELDSNYISAFAQENRFVHLP